MLVKFWKVLRKPSAKYSLGLLLTLGIVVGIIGWGGFHTVMEATNDLEFCISCHEMENTVYQEYKKTVHYTNRSGVRAICSDCHVPKEWGPKVIRKIKASAEIYHKLVGSIDTKEKFEAKRLELAQNVWAAMEATDSRECRNCHSWEAMDPTKQQEKSVKQMKKGRENGETCIACHKGIAHKLPDMSQGYKAMYEELQALAKKEEAKADTLYTVETQSFFSTEEQAANGKKPDGRLLGLTEVSVLERKGDLLKVRIDGWQQDKVGGLIYALQGKRIFSAALGKKIRDKVVIHKTELDTDTELTWHQVSLDVWVPKGKLLANKGKLLAYGKEMFSASCSVCHSTPAPEHSLANQWIGTLKAMKRFISLDKEQYRFLQKYLQFNAQDTSGGKYHG
ncbi:NapC/NirT family cytochrome c [Sedimenticola thiotaurini]|uniref:Cytochrome c-type protein n=1 Tax=Sedimenticola thiotaurini TaxID=1543721 RepID=A0A0F7K1C2_9GAMM|nr:NapC/NirT family cytochrome c [Sedimenticola thiotaurini]AKH20748.1 cytochrome C [Sedimenticola thiotaurini]